MIWSVCRFHINLGQVATPTEPPPMRTVGYNTCAVTAMGGEGGGDEGEQEEKEENGRVHLNKCRFLLLSPLRRRWQRSGNDAAKQQNFPQNICNLPPLHCQLTSSFVRCQMQLMICTNLKNVHESNKMFHILRFTCFDLITVWV